jgi:hypothetical protein
VLNKIIPPTTRGCVTIGIIWNINTF